MDSVTRKDLDGLRKLRDAYKGTTPYTDEIRQLEQKWEGVDVLGLLLDALELWMPSETDVH